MFRDDRLDERKRIILRAIIDDYIDTAEPVGSRTIARKHELGLSSATIRNEMADLEYLGYLAQPHTSAGRVPSDKGYRLYVNELMELKDLPVEEIDDIKNALEIRINELSHLIRQASVIMSRITRYTSIAIAPKVKKSVLKAVQVVPIDVGRVLVIVVTNTGTVRNTIVQVSESLQPDYLIRISSVLNEELSNMTLDQINSGVIAKIDTVVGGDPQQLAPIFNGVFDCIKQIDTAEVYMEGSTNILNYPEFKDIVRAKEFLNMLDAKDLIYRILEGINHENGIKIQIGNENEINEIKDCSIVTSTYSVGDNVLGTIGIIGPTRMEYPRVISSINYIRRKINEELNKILGESKNNST